MSTTTITRTIETGEDVRRLLHKATKLDIRAERAQQRLDRFPDVDPVDAPSVVFMSDLGEYRTAVELHLDADNVDYCRAAARALRCTAHDLLVRELIQRLDQKAALTPEPITLGMFDVDLFAKGIDEAMATLKVPIVAEKAQPSRVQPLLNGGALYTANVGLLDSDTARLEDLATQTAPTMDRLTAFCRQIEAVRRFAGL